MLKKLFVLEWRGQSHQPTQAAAHAVRVLGNDMAHGDFVAPISDEDTWLVIELMGEILNEIFQSRAKIKRPRPPHKHGRLQAEAANRK